MIANDFIVDILVKYKVSKKRILYISAVTLIILSGLLTAFIYSQFHTIASIILTLCLLMMFFLWEMYDLKKYLDRD